MDENHAYAVKVGEAPTLYGPFADPQSAADFARYIAAQLGTPHTEVVPLWSQHGDIFAPYRAAEVAGV